jgi:glycosyltransferase involved in cell wall biosynthesis
MENRSSAAAEELSGEKHSKNLGVVKRVVISSFDNPSNPHYNGGGVAVVEMIANRLASHFDVTVVTAGKRRDKTYGDKIHYRTLPIGWAGPRIGQLLYHMLLPFSALRIPHDLWIENFTPPFSTSFLPLFGSKRVVGFAQSLSGVEMSLRYHLPFFLIERLGLRFYPDVVVLNSADQETVRKCNPAATVHLIPNGIRTGHLDERLVGSGDHILFLGRIDTWKKGLDILLAAYEQSNLSIPLIIAGSGTPREERKLSDLIARTKGDVRWVGFVSGARKEELLERSSFMVMPSRHETFGLTALESMSHGKPVLHFDLPTLNWMEGDVRAVPHEVGSLANQMCYLDDDDIARRELGIAAHKAARRFSHDQVGDRYVALAQELLGASMAESEAEGMSRTHE